MFRQLAVEAGRPAFNEIAAAGISPSGLQEFKRERLLELRAMIVAMRSESGQELLDAFARKRIHAE